MKGRAEAFDNWLVVNSRTKPTVNNDNSLMSIPTFTCRSPLVALFAALLSLAFGAVAQSPGPSDVAVGAAVVLPDSAGNGAANAQQHFEVPLGFQVSLQHHEELKHKLPGNVPTGGTQISTDPNTGSSSSGGNGFIGPMPSGWIPYDAAIAVGTSHVLVMANAQWAVYSKTGTLLRGPTDLGTWWGTAAGTPFDPKCFFNGGHYVMLATSKGNGLANMYLSVSQTDDPTGAWWNYTYDWRLDGTTLTTNWGDFPGLGYDDNCIYINRAIQLTLVACKLPQPVGCLRANWLPAVASQESSA